MAFVNASAVKEWLRGPQEVALVDVREAGQYGEGHPFFAVNLPYSMLEIHAFEFLPNRNVNTILLDDNDGLAERARSRLQALGYSQISVLQGGAKAWTDAGYTLFKGVNLPSKAYGELAEHACNTPSISAAELNELLQQSDPPVLVDGRTPSEFGKMNIPGARSLPNAELAHRIGQFTDSDSQIIIVNCAGRTRSIIGAQTLRNVGIPNPVYALRNGTSGWTLAGLTLERGSEPEIHDELTHELAQISKHRALNYCKTYKIPEINLNTLLEWQQDTSRTLYLFDVRTESEFQRGHLQSSRHAPGGQLVQSTDQWVAVRGATIVLVDDTGLRAATTAHWLRTMGHNACVLDEDVTQISADLNAASLHTDVLSLYPALPTTRLDKIETNVFEHAVLVDLSSSRQYRAEHLTPAVWSIRSRLIDLARHQQWQTDKTIILCGATEQQRTIAAQDLFDAGFTNVLQLLDERSTWSTTSLGTVSTPTAPVDSECIDYLFFVHDRHDGNLVAAKEYLAWETNLINQIDDDERNVFNLESPLMPQS